MANKGISQFIKDIYRLYKLGKGNGESLISVDESLFIHLNRQKTWVLVLKILKQKK